MHGRTRLILSLGLGLLLLAAAILAAPAEARSPRPDSLDLPPPGDAERIVLELPADLPPAFDVGIVLDGEPATLSMWRHDLRAPGFRVRAWYSDGRTVALPAPPIATYRGRLVGKDGSAVVGHLTDDGLHATIVVEDSTQWQLRPAGPLKQHALWRGAVDVPAGCPGGLGTAVAATGPLPESGSTTQHLAQIAFDADFEYYQLKGSSVPNVVSAIEAILNQVDFFYARDVLITYTLTDTIVRTALFYTPTGGGDLLDQFRAEWNTNQTAIVRDMAHLMTNKNNIEFGGLAWVGAVCNDIAYGWSLDSAGIVGHEVGHNWGAGHCADPAPCNNMCGACLNVAPVTKGIISAYRDSRTCIDEVGGHATPLPPYAHPDETDLTRDDVAAGAIRTFDVLANDHDGNFDTLSLDGFDTVSDNNGSIALSAGTGAGGADELVWTAPATVFPGDDAFAYSVGDGTGFATTGDVLLRVSEPTLAGFWKFDDGLGTEAIDSSGWNRTGVVEGAALWVPSPRGGALTFDGIDDAVVAPAMARSTTSATISGWVYRNGSQAAWAGILFSRGGATVAGLHFGTANELRYTWNNDGATYNWNSGLVVPDQRWSFVALVVEPAQATMWLDSGLGLTSAVNPIAHASEEFDAAITIGQDPNSTFRRFAGFLDEIQFYDHAFDATQVAALRDLGAKAHAPNPPDGGLLLRDVAELTWSAALNAISHDVYLGTDYLSVRDATTGSPEFRGNSATAVHVPALAVPDGTILYWRVDERSAGADTIKGDVWIFTTGSANHRWPLDESNGTGAVDVEGSRHGTYAGAPILAQSPARADLGASVYFDGIDDRVEIPTLNLLTDTLTITAWIRRDGAQSAFDGLVFSRGGNTTAGLNLGNANELRYHWNNGQWDWDSGLIVPDDTWVFVALVVEPQRATIYLGNTATLQNAIHVANHGIEEFDGLLQIGRDPTGGRQFKGWIDDVRLYKSALSSTDIAGLHAAVNAAGSVPQLTVQQLAGGDLQLDWLPACSGGSDYAVYEGSLGDFAGHVPLTCSTGAALSTIVTPGSGSHYYLVAPIEGNREGGYGADGTGTPRPASPSACRPSFATNCP